MRVPIATWKPRGEAFNPASENNSSGFPAILTHLIRQRGFLHSVDLDRYLNPKLQHLSDPFLLPDMAAAVERILQAVDRQEAVCIYGDYDVDGITSITIMSKLLAAYGLKAKAFVPNRGKEGYGLSMAAIERCLLENGKPDLLITVDCGTCSTDEIAYLKQLGIETLVVDHHEPSEIRPDCCAIVNPKCGDSHTYLCAAGVVFKLGHALLKTRQLPNFDLKQIIDLVAVATVADIVPLVEENRLLVRQGLRYLQDTQNFGLQELIKISGVTGDIKSTDLGFRIGPRINAAGRMDFPEEALLALNTNNLTEAEHLVKRLNQYNQERQQYENTIREEAVKMLSETADFQKYPIIVLGSRNWHHGVVGIVASRLMRLYHKPTFVISINDQGVGKGSGRSIEGLSLVDAIRNSADLLLAGGGHAMAAGLSVKEENIDAFRKSFSDYVLANATPEQLKPTLWYDAELPLSLLSLEFLASYELLQPFGSCNPQPVFIATNVDCENVFELKNNHLRLKLVQDDIEIDAMFFGGGENPLPPPPWDIAFTIDKNIFRGKTSLQLLISQIRSHQ